MHPTLRKCQNIERHITRRWVAAISPGFDSLNIKVTSQTMPKVTCSPCVPTRVKKLERKALRCGPAPISIRWWNSYSSIPRKASPNSPVRSEEHTSELQPLLRTSYAVLCLKKQNRLEAHLDRLEHLRHNYVLLDPRLTRVRVRC